MTTINSVFLTILLTDSGWFSDDGRLDHMAYLLLVDSDRLHIPNREVQLCLARLS